MRHETQQIHIVDTHAYVKRLKAVGFTEEQAEVQAQTIAELINERLATKQDLERLEMHLTLKMGAFLAAAVGIVAALVKLL